jgi:heme/copper-type cytochrome/quinol oxidase subunit 2
MNVKAFMVVLFSIILGVSQINYYFCMRYNSETANNGDND